jgi:hypothetical protein
VLGRNSGRVMTSGGGGEDGLKQKSQDLRGNAGNAEYDAETLKGMEKKCRGEGSLGPDGCRDWQADERASMSDS